MLIFLLQFLSGIAYRLFTRLQKNFAQTRVAEIPCSGGCWFFLSVVNQNILKNIKHICQFSTTRMMTDLSFKRTRQLISLYGSIINFDPQQMITLQQLKVRNGLAISLHFYEKRGACSAAGAFRINMKMHHLCHGKK